MSDKSDSKPVSKSTPAKQNKPPVPPAKPDPLLRDIITKAEKRNRK